MNESTQRLFEMQNKELVAMSDKLIKVSDQLERALVELELMKERYEPLKKTFDEVLQETLEYREKLQYKDEENWLYDKYEKANLL
jgi:archaellum component FlaC